MLEVLLVLVIVGAIAGFTARSLVPGPDPMGTIGTIGLGILGAFLGTYLMGVLLDQRPSATSLTIETIVGAVLGAIVVLVLVRATVGRGSFGRGRAARR